MTTSLRSPPFRFPFLHAAIQLSRIEGNYFAKREVSQQHINRIHIHERSSSSQHGNTATTHRIASHLDNLIDRRRHQQDDNRDRRIHLSNPSFRLPFDPFLKSSRSSSICIPTITSIGIHNTLHQLPNEPLSIASEFLHLFGLDSIRITCYLLLARRTKT